MSVVLGHPSTDYTLSVDIVELGNEAAFSSKTTNSFVVTNPTSKAYHNDKAVTIAAGDPLFDLTGTVTLTGNPGYDISYGVYLLNSTYNIVHWGQVFGVAGLPTGVYPITVEWRNFFGSQPFQRVAQVNISYIAFVVDTSSAPGYTGTITWEINPDQTFAEDRATPQPCKLAKIFYGQKGLFETIFKYCP